MLDWLNCHLGEIIGLIHAPEKRYYQNKTQLRYNFCSVYIIEKNVQKQNVLSVLSLSLELDAIN